MEQIPLASDVCNIITQCGRDSFFAMSWPTVPDAVNKIYANLGELGPDVQRLVDRLNEYAVEGARELYEVMD
jgi:hypothetical protein